MQSNYNAEELLREDARNCDLESLKKRLKQGAKINAPDPITGRTAFHEACARKHSETIQELIIKNADQLQRDYLGFTGLELWITRFTLPKKETVDRIIRNSERQFYRECVINTTKNYLQKYNAHIVFIEHIEQLDLYIKNNPQHNKIGFIIEKPRCIRKMTHNDTHVVPIYFERHNQAENFVGLESARGDIIAIPSNNEIQRKLFYSPLCRQSSAVGCFEDAVELLTTLLSSTDVINYCNARSKEDKEISVELSENENRNYIALAKDQSHLDKQKQEILANYGRRVTFSRQRQIIEINHQKSCVNDIFQLSSLPSLIFIFIERFDTMRKLRTEESLRFFNQDSSGTSRIKELLRCNNKRTPNISDDEIEKNLHNNDKKYDFYGNDFKKRKDYYTSQFYASFEENQKNLFTLFANNQSTNTFNSENITDLIVQYSMEMKL